MKIQPNTTLVVKMSTHAPLMKRYMGPDRGYEAVGEDARTARIDPDTGAEYRALGGVDPAHRYNKDNKIGPSYPKTGFFTASDAEGEPLDHDALDELVGAVGLGQYPTAEVILPRGYDRGTPTWDHGLMVRPPGRATYLLRSAKRLLEERADGFYANGNVVEAFFRGDE